MNKLLLLGAMVGAGFGIAKLINKNKKEQKPETTVENAAATA